MNIQKNWIEWSVFGAGVAIVAGCVAALVVSMMRSADTPPDLRLTVAEPQRGATGHLVLVSIENRGDLTAEQVQAVVTLEAGGKELERAEVTFAYVPRRSKRQAFVLFQRDPHCCRISARAVGFGTP
jgi:uncharacterized protein (TIGR02588 family)